MKQNDWRDYPRMTGMSKGAQATWIGGAGLVWVLVIGGPVLLLWLVFG